MVFDHLYISKVDRKGIGLGAFEEARNRRITQRFGLRDSMGSQINNRRIRRRGIKLETACNKGKEFLE